MARLRNDITDVSIICQISKIVGTSEDEDGEDVDVLRRPVLRFLWTNIYRIKSKYAKEL